MRPAVEELDLGWQARPLAVAVACAVAILLAAFAVRAFGLLPGFGGLALFALVGTVGIQQGELEGPILRFRIARYAFAARLLHARAIDRLVFRPHPFGCRLRPSIERRGQTVELVLYGPSPTAPAFRAITLWLIVHGRRQTRIDPRLLDGLTVVTDHEDAGLPHDASHA